MFEEIVLCYWFMQFGYIFIGDYYVVGYYSYMWLEVMDVDVFGVFEEVGDIFDLVVVKCLYDDIYLSGGLVDLEVVYEVFCGWLFEFDVLLCCCGLFDVIKVV